MIMWRSWWCRGGHTCALAIVPTRAINAALKCWAAVAREVAATACCPYAVARGIASEVLPEHAFFTGQLLHNLYSTALWRPGRPRRRRRRAGAARLAGRVRGFVALTWCLVERAVCAAWVRRARATPVARGGACGSIEKDQRQQRLPALSHRFQTKSRARFRAFDSRALAHAYMYYTYARIESNF